MQEWTNPIIEQLLWAPGGPQISSDLRVPFAMRTRQGSVRTENQDRGVVALGLVGGERWLFGAVGDGIGGMPRGGEAAALGATAHAGDARVYSVGPNKHIVQLSRDDVLPERSDLIQYVGRSAVAVARVNHPSVTRTFDWFKEDNDNKEYLVEEFVDGLTLGDLVKKIPRLDPYAVAHLLHGLAKGVAAVHAQDVVHRDLKPSNIMLEVGLKIKSAKMAAEAIGDAVAGGAAKITTSKTAVGAIPYMAPEVIQRPRDVAPAADVWALGAIAYELLSGNTPFGQGFVAIPNILEAKAPPIPSEVQGNPRYRALGMEFHGIIVRCLTKDEGKRPHQGISCESASGFATRDAARSGGGLSLPLPDVWLSCRSRRRCDSILPC